LRFDETAGLVSLTNVWRRICSVTIFLKRKVVETIGGFDEMMGLGAGTPWEGGEDIDYPVRAMRTGGEWQNRFTPMVRESGESGKNTISHCGLLHTI
jgi:hypothetical protein